MGLYGLLPHLLLISLVGSYTVPSQIRKSSFTLRVLKWEASSASESNVYMKELDTLASRIPKSVQLSRIFYVISSSFKMLRAFLLEEDSRERNRIVCDEIIDLGPVSIKLGQSLSCRPDLCGEELSEELKRLTDKVPPAIDFDQCVTILKEDFAQNQHLERIVETLSGAVACASLGQVHKAHIPSLGDVAVKIQRPNLTEAVVVDVSIAIGIARFLQNNWGIDSDRSKDKLLFRTNIVLAALELGSRLIEELDYKNEAENLEIFSSLYADGGTASASLPPPGVIVPNLIPSLCSDRVITMTWINETSKLLEAKGDGEGVSAGFTLESLTRVEQEDLKKLSILGIECSLSQLLETGYLHADPHSGNLLRGPNGKLVYLDFGLVSYVPPQVREGLVCAILYLIEKDYTGLALEFDDLLLLQTEYLEKNVIALKEDLENTAARILTYNESAVNPNVPKLNFDELVFGFTDIAIKHEFISPPYFLSNIRAIGALEGFALAVDPDFNLFKVIYPFILKRVLLSGKEKSKKIETTFRSMVLRAENGLLNVPKCLEMLDDAASMGGIEKPELIKTFLSQPEGRRFALEIAWKHVNYYLFRPVKNIVYTLMRGLLKRFKKKRNDEAIA